MQNSSYEESEVDALPRPRHHTAWEAPSSYGVPPDAPPIPNKPSHLKIYEDSAQKSQYEAPWSADRNRASTAWSGQHYEIVKQQSHTTVNNYETNMEASDPWSFSSYDIVPDQAKEDELFRQRPDGSFSNPLRPAEGYDQITAAAPATQPTTPAPSYYQRAKNFLWCNTQRRVTTVIITTLIIGGIIGAYLGLSSSTSTHSAQNTGDRNCTYPEGVNATFNQLQETFSAQNSSLTIPGLDPATCSLISTVINNTVRALKMGGYACWQNVQSALMPLASSAIALNADSIQQIITAVKQYCFPNSSSSTVASPVPSSVVTTIPPGTTAVTTTSPAPTIITSTLTSTSSTDIQTTVPSQVTSSTGVTTTLPPSTTTTMPLGTTTVTTTVPTSTSTVFVSTSTPTTMTTTTTTSTTTSTTTTTTTTMAPPPPPPPPPPPCSSYSGSGCPSRCSCCAPSGYNLCPSSTTTIAPGVKKCTYDKYGSGCSCGGNPCIVGGASCC